MSSAYCSPPPAAPPAALTGALPAAFGQEGLWQTAAIKQIMVQCVVTNSSNKYERKNSGFAIFCFDSTVLRDHLLEPWFIEGMRPIKKPNNRKKYAKECCLSSSLEDNNCPFMLSHLLFAQFSNFLATRTSRMVKHQGQMLKLLNA